MTIFSVNISKPKHRQWSWSTFNHWLSIDWFSINKLIGIRSLAMSQHPIEGVEIKWALQTILLPAPGIVNDPFIFFFLSFQRTSSTSDAHRFRLGSSSNFLYITLKSKSTGQLLESSQEGQVQLAVISSNSDRKTWFQMKYCK